MPQVFGFDRFGNVSVVNSTTVQVNLSDRGDIKVTFGGQQYHWFSALQINTAVNGVGGLDSGGPGNKKVWFVYLVLSGGLLNVVASQSATAPTGFSTYQWTGWFFFTGYSGEILLSSKDTISLYRNLTTSITSGYYAVYDAGFTTPNIPNSVWELKAHIGITEAGVACTFTYMYAQFSPVDGDNTNTGPPALPFLSGSIASSFGYLGAATFGGGTWEFGQLSIGAVLVSGGTLFYVTPSFSYSPGVAGVAISMTARRVS